MNIALCLFIGLLVTVSLRPGMFQPSQAAVNESSNRQIDHLKQAYGQRPMYFERNEGQSDKAVKYLARGHGYQIFLTNEKAILKLALATGDAAALQLSFNISNGSPVGLNQLPTKSNYILGNNPLDWRTDVTNFAGVKYSEIQPGVDLAFYGTQRALEYDFILAPGADPSQITLTIDGADKLELADNGDLLMHLGDATVVHRAPQSYQGQGQKKRLLNSRYVLKGGNQLGFALVDYDSTQTLIIDPVIDYSTFLGGTGSDEGFAIAVDNAGNAYITGTTYSNNFNTFAPLQTLNGGANLTPLSRKLMPREMQFFIRPIWVGQMKTAGRELLWIRWVMPTSRALPIPPTSLHAMLSSPRSTVKPTMPSSPSSTAMAQPSSIRHISAAVISIRLLPSHWTQATMPIS